VCRLGKATSASDATQAAAGSETMTSCVQDQKTLDQDTGLGTLGVTYRNGGQIRLPGVPNDKETQS
jgi:hypothetical protein